jgi:hypothetical protein
MEPCAPSLQPRGPIPWFFFSKIILKILENPRISYVVRPLWNLCDYFVIILCDILKYNLIGIVLTYNFNFRR